MRQHFFTAGPLIQILGKAQAEKVFGGRADAMPVFSFKLWHRFIDRLLNRYVLVGHLEWHLSAQQSVSHHASTPHISLEAAVLPVYQLWSHKLLITIECPFQVPITAAMRRVTEVVDLNLHDLAGVGTDLGDEDVLQINIPMDNLTPMQIQNSREQLLRNKFNIKLSIE